MSYKTVSTIHFFVFLLIFLAIIKRGTGACIKNNMLKSLLEFVLLYCFDVSSFFSPAGCFGDYMYKEALSRDCLTFFSSGSKATEGKLKAPCKNLLLLGYLRKIDSKCKSISLCQGGKAKESEGKRKGGGVRFEGF